MNKGGKVYRLLNSIFKHIIHAKAGNVERLFVYIKLIKNWRYYLLIRLGLIDRRKNTRLFLRSGGSILFREGNEGQFRYLVAKELLKNKNIKIDRIDEHTCLVHLDRAKIIIPYENLPLIYANFVIGEYSKVNADGKIVVDIGANVGDTPLYFLRYKNARKVIAIEPNEEAFRILKKNIILNKLGSRCIPLRCAAGAVKGNIYIKKGGFLLFESIHKNNLKKGLKTRVLTLDEIIDRFKLKDAILKLDCEGCEEDVINYSKISTLRKFEQIIVETTSKEIKKKLSAAGFNAKIPFLHPDIIYAVRKRLKT
jgi:FkbM family methyltransferase